MPISFTNLTNQIIAFRARNSHGTLKKSSNGDVIALVVGICVLLNASTAAESASFFTSAEKRRKYI